MMILVVIHMQGGLKWDSVMYVNTNMYSYAEKVSKTMQVTLGQWDKINNKILDKYCTG